MNEKETPLKPVEVSKLLSYLLRLSATGQNEVVKRLAKSLLNVVMREKIREDNQE